MVYIFKRSRLAGAVALIKYMHSSPGTLLPTCRAMGAQ